MKLRNGLYATLFLLIIAAMFLGSCDDRSTDLPDFQIVSMTASPDTIYADNNITYSTITVLVKDEDDFAITGETVTFRSNIGSIIKNVTTDSTGVAETEFWDSGDMGLATIEAFIYDISETVEVYVDSIPDVESLEFTQIPTELYIDETTTIKVKAETEIGMVSDGTSIVLETNNGFFQTVDDIEIGNIVSVETTNGVAQTEFNAGTFKGEATITAALADFSVDHTITVHPGTPKFLYLFIDEDSTEVAANSDVSVNIEALVEDKHHNPVESGVGVTFSTTLGNVIEYGATNDLGITSTSFSPGITAGTAQIDAVADSASATTFINVDNSNLIEIQVSGTGGVESAELSASLRDMSGNLVDLDQMVYYEIVAGPLGTNINNSGNSDSTMSVNGHAVVSINSGSESGIARVICTTYNELNEPISAETSVIVNAGPPNSAEFAIGGHDTGTDMSGGVWKVEVAAIITDVFGNPVKAGTPVFFSLPDDPDFASIVAGAYVGNENADGDSLAGTAFTTLTYDGSYTNTEINTLVEVGGIETFPGSLVLPIQFPVIDLAPVPQHLDWHGAETAPLYMEVRCTVKDGQNNPIDNQELVFYSTLGQPIEPTPPDTGDPYTGLTHEVDGVHGRLDKMVRFEYTECPEPSAAGPGTTTATITVHILGTGTTNTTTIILFRYAE